MTTPPTGGVGSPDVPRTSPDNFRGLDPDAFFKLLIAELQNQDPLDPLDNTQLLQQVATIREVGVSLQLNETLKAVMLGQQISSAASLLGREVRGLAQSGDEVTGVVDRVTIADEQVLLHVGEEKIPLNNVAEILPQGSSDDSN